MSRGIYVRISRLAEIIGVSETAVVAAQKICGHVRIAHRIWFSDGVRPDFVEEALLANGAEQSAEQRRKRAAQARLDNPER